MAPTEGAAASTRVAAICKSTDQPDIAKAFVEFLLDPEVQQELIDTGDEAYFTPSVEGVTAKPDREPNPTLVAADVQFGAENEADIKAWFAGLFCTVMKNSESRISNGVFAILSHLSTAAFGSSTFSNRLPRFGDQQILPGKYIDPWGHLYQAPLEKSSLNSWLWRRHPRSAD